METRKLIFNRLEDLLRKTPTINKFFVFNISDLKDDPEGCLEVIESYLERHKDKIKDIEFHSWIDEETFSPVLMMKMILSDELSSHLHHSNLLNSLLPSSSEENLLRERISRIFEKYEYEFNFKEIRENILKELEFVLNQEIIDRSNMEDVDKNSTAFKVKSGNEEIFLSDYLKKIADKKRYED